MPSVANMPSTVVDEGSTDKVVFTARTDAETESYYDKQKKIYQQVWDDEGRICWGFFKNLDTSSFKEAGLFHVERMCGMHNDSKNGLSVPAGISKVQRQFRFHMMPFHMIQGICRFPTF